ncbi:MAG: hypothetical protein V4486_03160 [Patescibacteria group bacterium]
MKRRAFSVLVCILWVGACSSPTTPTNHIVCFPTDPVNVAGDLGFSQPVNLQAAEEDVERATGTFSASASAPGEVSITSAPATYAQAFSPCTGRPAAQINQIWTIKTLKKGTTIVTFKYSGANGEKKVTLTIR